MTDEEVRDLLRRTTGTNAAAWARDNDISPQYVNDVLNHRRRPGDAILTALGLTRVVTYEPKGVAI